MCRGFSDAGFKIADAIPHFSNGARLPPNDVIVLVSTATGTELKQFRRNRRLQQPTTQCNIVPYEINPSKSPSFQRKKTVSDDDVL